MLSKALKQFALAAAFALSATPAFNAAMVGLHRYFGPLRMTRNPEEPQAHTRSEEHTSELQSH